MTASVVIHKTAPVQIERMLACLLRSDVERVFVVDNSPENYPVPELPDDGRIAYRRVNNRGFAAGHNEVIREILANGDFHLVMNADVWWDGNVPGKIVDYLELHPDVGLIAPKVYYPDGDLQYSCRMLPRPFDLFAKRFLPGGMIRRRMERYLLVDHDHDKPLDCPYLLGCFLMFRVEALRDCGIFDERFFMYPEDIDITRRIHERWKTLYYPQVCIVHEHAAASRKSLRMLLIHLWNMVRYFNKWGWFFDSHRRQFNHRLIQSMTVLPSSCRPSGRG